MEELKDFIYQTKCRRCNRLNENWFSDELNSNREVFLIFINEHSSIPFQRQCQCYNGGITIQDLVSHNSIY